MGFVNKIFAICGMFAPILLLVSVLAAISISGGNFSWTNNALSDLGIQANAGQIFNGGLMTAAALMMVFSIGIFLSLKKSLFGLVCAVILLVESIALFGIGAFNENSGLHYPFAFGFFGIAAIRLILFSIYFFKEKSKMLGLTTIFLLILAVVSWLVTYGFNGIAIPEFASVFFAYILIIIIGAKMFWESLIQK